MNEEAWCSIVLGYLIQNILSNGRRDTLLFHWDVSSFDKKNSEGALKWKHFQIWSHLEDRLVRKFLGRRSSQGQIDSCETGIYDV